jgi:hypothetical protein
MADRYWVGGSGTWNLSSTANWSASSGGASGASAPTAADNVIVDGNSGTPGTITISGNALTQSLNVYVGGWTFAGTANPILNIGNTQAGITGGFSIANNTTWTNTGIIKFNNFGTFNVTTNGTVFNSPIEFNNSGTTWRINDKLSVANSVVLNQGFLLINTAIECTTFRITAVGSAATKGITWRSPGNIQVTSSNAVVFNIAGASATFATNDSYQTQRVFLTNTATYGGFREIHTGSTYNWNFNVLGGFDTVYVGERAITQATTAGRVLDLDLSGFGGTFRYGLSTASLSIIGNLALSSTMTWPISANTITFSATAGISQISSNTNQINASVIFNGTGGTWLLNGNANVNEGNTVTLTAGTVNLGNVTLSTGNLTTSGSTARSITFGNTGQIVLTGSNSQILNWDIASGYSSLSNMRIITNYTGSTGTRWIRISAAELSSPNVGTLPITGARTSGGNIQIIGGSDNLVVSGSVWDLNLQTYTGTFGIGPGLTAYSNINLGSISNTNATASGGTINFLIIGGTQTFDRILISNAEILNIPVRVNMTAGGVVLADNLTFNANTAPALVLGPIDHTSGNLDLNDKILTTPRYTSWSGDSVRQLRFDNFSQIILTGSNATVWDTTTALNWSYTGTANVIASPATTVGTRRYAFGNLRKQFTLNVSADTSSQLSFGTVPAGTLELSGNIGSLNMVGFTGGLANNLRVIHSDFTLPSGANILAGTLATVFNNTTTTSNINSNAVTLSFPVHFGVAAGGTFRLVGNLTLGATNAVNFSAGTLSLNNSFVNANSIVSTSGLTRVINFGTSGGISIFGANSTIINMTGTIGVQGTYNFNSTYRGSTGTRTLIMPGTQKSDAWSVDFGSATDTANTVVVVGGTDVLNIQGSSNDIILDGFTGTFANATRSVYGNLSVDALTTIQGGTLVTTFAGTAGVPSRQSITSRDKQFTFPVTIDNPGGNVTIPGNLTLNASNTFTLTRGEFDVNTYVLSTGIFDSSNTLSRGLKFGIGGKIQLTSSAATTIWNQGVSSAGTNFYRIGIPNVEIVGGGATTKTWNNGVSGFTETNSPDVTLLHTGGTVDFSNGTLGNLIIRSNSAVRLGALTLYGNYDIQQLGSLTPSFTTTITFSGSATRTQTINTSGLMHDAPFTFNGAGVYQLISNLQIGAARTLTFTSGNLFLNNSELRCGLFLSSGSGSRFLTCSNGALLITGSAAAASSLTVWTLSGNANWTTIGNTNIAATNSRVISGTRIFDNTGITTGDWDINVGNPISQSGNVITISNPNDSVQIFGRWGNIDFTGYPSSNLVYLSGGAAATITGNLTIPSNVQVGSSASTTTFAPIFGRRVYLNVPNIGMPKLFPTRINFGASGSGNVQLLTDLNIGSIGSSTLAYVVGGELDISNIRLSVARFVGDIGQPFTLNFGSYGQLKTHGTYTSAGDYAINVYANPVNLKGNSNVVVASNVLNFSTAGLEFGTRAQGHAWNVTIISSNTTGGGHSINGNVNNLVWDSACGWQYQDGVQSHPTVIQGNLEVTKSITAGAAFDLTAPGNKTIYTNANVVFTNIVTLRDFNANWTLLSNLSQNAASSSFTFVTGNLTLNNFTVTARSFDASTGVGKTLNFNDQGRIVAQEAYLSHALLATTGNTTVEMTSPRGTATLNTGEVFESNVVNVALIGSGTFSWVRPTAVRNLNINNVNAIIASNPNIRIYGDYTYNSGNIRSSNNAWIFSGSGNNNRITTNSFIHDLSWEFAAGNGTYILNDNLVLGYTRNVTLTSGTLDLNDKSISLGVFISNSTAQRTLQFDNVGVINIQLSANTTVVNTFPSTNLVISGNSAIYIGNGIAAGNTITINTNNAFETRTLNFYIRTGAANSVVNFVTNSSVRDLNFGGTSSTILNSNLNIYGNVTLATTATIRGGANTWVFASTSGQETIETDGQQITWPFRFDGVGGNWKLLDDLNISNSNTLILSSGNLDAGVSNVFLSQFNSTVANVRTLSIGTGNWTVYGNSNSWFVQNTGFSVTGSGNIVMAANTTKTFNGGNAAQYPTLVNAGTGDLIIRGNNNITTLTHQFGAGSWLFAPNSITTLDNWNINGQDGNLVTIDSITTGQVHFLRKFTGSVEATYLYIQDSNAAGGATFLALYSTNAGNNTGWSFSVNNANFLLLFV